MRGSVTARVMVRVWVRISLEKPLIGAQMRIDAGQSLLSGEDVVTHFEPGVGFQLQCKLKHYAGGIKEGLRLIGIAVAPFSLAVPGLILIVRLPHVVRANLVGDVSCSWGIGSRDRVTVGARD